MNFKDLKCIIPKLKLSNLNSKTSQIKLAPSFRKEFIKLNSNKLLNSKKAAVTAALYADENNLVRLILILRNTYNGVHSNQIGFPGGRVEEDDKTLFDTDAQEVDNNFLDDISEFTFNCYSTNKNYILQKNGVNTIRTLYTDSYSDVSLARISKQIIIVNNDKLIKCKDINEFNLYFNK